MGIHHATRNREFHSQVATALGFGNEERRMLGSPEGNICAKEPAAGVDPMRRLTEPIEPPYRHACVRNDQAPFNV